MTFDDFFKRATDGRTPWGWQRDLAAETHCSSRTVRIATGYGKTLGVLIAWLWHRAQHKNENWPRRLVWCLPMRVLVEQIKEEVEKALSALDLLWDGEGDHCGRIGVHLLMGGADAGAWHLYPEESAVLIGTQDMLLSRAMNRGYGAPRARWPMEFGLLHQDCLWVMDEVQLMDVGLATSVQLQAFRDQDKEQRVFLRPHATWWMSATLQTGWLAKSPDTTGLAAALGATRIALGQRCGHLWDDVSKPCALVDAKSTKAITRIVAERHIEGKRGAAGPTLVVLNRVDTAVDVWEMLSQDKQLKGTDVRLVHSRFRPAERAKWAEGILNRDACKPDTDRILVATQVIEAGIDYSAAILVTELAPWASLVQRFGRCARWGGNATVIVLDLAAKDDKAAAPYSKAELDAARSAFAALARSSRLADGPDTTPSMDVAPLALERFEESHPDLMTELYPYDPAQLLLRHELDELFDTTPDLSGADVDISRFIRTGDERDIQAFWVNLPPRAEPSAKLRPLRNELCSIPFLATRDWLCGKENKSDKKPRLKDDMHAWVWDWPSGDWRKAERRDIYPGQTLLIAAECGGYDPQRGWSPESRDRVEPPDTIALHHPVEKPCWRLEGKIQVIDKKLTQSVAADEICDSVQDSEALSVSSRWKTIATHGLETGRIASEVAVAVAPELEAILSLAGRWHDAGKGHDAFQVSMRLDGQRPFRNDLAKAPEEAWPCALKRMYNIGQGQRRPGFRHELASTLALFGILRRHRPDHPALLGPWGDLLRQANLNAPLPPGRVRESSEPTPVEQEILALDAEQFDLLAYLVCAHHGKVRVAWHVSKADQEAGDTVLRIRGIRDGETLPAILLAAADGSLSELPPTPMDLSPASAGLSPRTGASWTDRVLALLDRYGPFALAYLEALLRAADQRASRSKVADPILETQNARHGLETSDRAVAKAPSGGANAHSPQAHSPQGGTEHGLRGGAGESRDARRGTQAPRHATRHLVTSLGILSYAELAPHLALRVQDLEVDIADGHYAGRSLDEDLIRQLHQRICGDLVPDIAGRWRRIDVRVSEHQAPTYPRVPILMRDYCLDLQARCASLSGPIDDRTLEFLAFAEGRLLWIHPFADFNGRTSRVLLAELLRRLGLPDIDPTPDPGPETQRYLAALRAADRGDWNPLIACWIERFGKEGQP